jgi:hypothetical protein
VANSVPDVIPPTKRKLFFQGTAVASAIGRGSGVTEIVKCKGKLSWRLNFTDTCPFPKMWVHPRNIKNKQDAGLQGKFTFAC